MVGPTIYVPCMLITWRGQHGLPISSCKKKKKLVPTPVAFSLCFCNAFLSFSISRLLWLSLSFDSFEFSDRIRPIIYPNQSGSPFIVILHFYNFFLHNNVFWSLRGYNPVFMNSATIPESNSNVFTLCTAYHT